MIKLRYVIIKFIEYNECWNFPCKNGATCTDDHKYYNCFCAPGYSGKNCTTCK